MTYSSSSLNLPTLLAEAFEFLRVVIETRLQLYFGQAAGFEAIEAIPYPREGEGRKWFAQIVGRQDLTPWEIITILIALAPHVKPQLLDDIIQQTLPNAGDFPQLGGIRGKKYRGFLPTGETILFLLAGEHLEERFRVQQLFSSDYWFSQKNILHLSLAERHEPLMSGQLILDREYVEKITLGKASKPTFSSEFPASLISTQLDWEDLVLPTNTFEQIQDINMWLNHYPTLMNELGMNRKLKPGYRALFYGSPGTGKTMTASLLGKSTSRDVYRVDLSSVVSKYIGETEKNLSNLFNRAENKNWILFFDEADALFGRRTQVQNAHDKYANQEVSYLLQRVENHNGLVILASNFKSNIDEAFLRRFQSIIHFPMPRTYERLQLWQKTFPEKIVLDEDVNLKSIAQKYELTGADIMNVVQHVCLKAIKIGDLKINTTNIVSGIKREFMKSGKIS